jgi:P-type Na+/K+ transporter
MGKQVKEEQNYSRQPFLLPVEDVVQYLQTNVESGLSSAQVKQYQEKYGVNKLDGDGGIPWYALLMKQIANAMILVSLPFSSCNDTIQQLTFLRY